MLDKLPQSKALVEDMQKKFSFQQRGFKIVVVDRETGTAITLKPQDAMLARLFIGLGFFSFEREERHELRCYLVL